MTDRYDDYTRDELIRELRQRDRRPRFGLVWERKEIEHEKAVNEDFIALDFDAGLSCGSAPYRNFIIEGDIVSPIMIYTRLMVKLVSVITNHKVMINQAFEWGVTSRALRL